MIVYFDKKLEVILERKTTGYRTNALKMLTSETKELFIGMMIVKYPFLYTNNKGVTSVPSPNP